jgi:hypothetical protein
MTGRPRAALRGAVWVAMAIAWPMAMIEPTRAVQFGKIFGRNDKMAFTSFKDASGRFTLDFPAKDWRTMPTPGASLAILAHKDFEATLVVDYKRLDVPLDPADVSPTFAEIETEAIKERQSAAKDFKAEIVDTPAGRGALIRYSNAGQKGPDRVIQFSIPIRQDLYRLIGSIRQPLLAKHEPTIMHMIQSFVPGSARTDKD